MQKAVRSSAVKSALSTIEKIRSAVVEKSKSAPRPRRKGNGASAVLFLDRPGKLEAKAFLADLKNEEIVGKWSPSKKSARKPKPNKRRTETTNQDTSLSTL